MKKNKFIISTVLSVAFLVMLLTTLALPEVKGIVTHYTIQPGEGFSGVAASRCDHLVDPDPPPAYDDAYTSCGIAAHYYVVNESYAKADFCFTRGYGCGEDDEDNDHDWETYGPMVCNYQVDSNYGTYYDYTNVSWSNPDWSGYWGYHQPLWQFSWNPIQPYLDGYTVGATSGSYFEEVDYPYDQIYISSPISPNDMYATGPSWREE
jgi:hypothetical protein